MGQLSKAERDLLEKFMKAREGHDVAVKQNKVGRTDQCLLHLCYFRHAEYNILAACMFMRILVYKPLLELTDCLHRLK